jgi:hypothetical protein
LHPAVDPSSIVTLLEVDQLVGTGVCVRDPCADQAGEDGDHGDAQASAMIVL